MHVKFTKMHKSMHINYILLSSIFENVPKKAFY